MRFGQFVLLELSVLVSQLSLVLSVQESGEPINGYLQLTQEPDGCIEYDHVFQELSIAQDAQRNGSSSECSRLLRRTLRYTVKINMDSPHDAFRCSTGVAAVCNILANCLNDQGYTGSVLLVRQYVAIFAAYDYQMKGEEYITKSKWPIVWHETIRDLMLAKLAAQDSTWGQFIWEKENTMSAYWFSQEAEIGDRDGNSSPFKEIIPIENFHIVSVCDYQPEETPLPVLSSINKRLYSKKWKYSLTMYDKAPIWKDLSIGNNFIDRPLAWSKIDAVIIALEDELRDGGRNVAQTQSWILWMDCDSFFSDFSVPLSHLIRISETERKILGHPKEVNLIVSEDGLMLNTGVFLVRVCDENMQLFKKVRNLTNNYSRLTFHSWWEQTGMLWVMTLNSLLSDIDHDLSLRDNSGFIPEVHLLGQRLMNVYPPMIARMLQTHIAYTVGDYIVSFSGCRTFSSKEFCNTLMISYFHQIPEMSGQLPNNLRDYFPY